MEDERATLKCKREPGIGAAKQARKINYDRTNSFSLQEEGNPNFIWLMYLEKPQNLF